MQFAHTVLSLDVMFGTLLVSLSLQMNCSFFSTVHTDSPTQGTSIQEQGLDRSGSKTAILDVCVCITAHTVNCGRKNDFNPKPDSTVLSILATLLCL
jgi:hypothetical protein